MVCRYRSQKASFSGDVGLARSRAARAARAELNKSAFYGAVSLECIMDVVSYV